MLSLRHAVVLLFLVGVPLWALAGGSPQALESLLGGASQELAAPAMAAPPPRGGNFHGQGLETSPAHLALAPRHESRGARDFTPLTRSVDEEPAAGEPPVETVVRDRFEEVRLELSRWGADYMALEYYGTEEAGYLFRCRVPLPEHPSYARPFTARDSDPLRAMEQVLAQVLDWRSEHAEGSRRELEARRR